ncbi:MAG: glycosyltransferase [Verrucomicrobiota bacterium]
MPEINPVEATVNIPRQIHFIWVGGAIPGQGAPHNYRQRIQQIANTLAPQNVPVDQHHHVNVWLSQNLSHTQADYDENRAWAQNANNVTPRNLDLPEELQLTNIERGAIALQWDTQPHNYGAISDIVRIAILDQHGGIYMDTDCRIGQMFDPNPLHAPFGFLVTRRAWNSPNFLNSIMASIPGGHFIVALRNAVGIRYGQISEMTEAEKYVALRTNAEPPPDGSAQSLINGYLNKLRSDIEAKTLLLAGPSRLDEVARNYTVNGAPLYSYTEGNVWDNDDVKSCIIPWLNMPGLPDQFNHARFGQMELAFHNGWLQNIPAPPQGNQAAAPNQGGPYDAAIGAAVTPGGMNHAT